MKATRSVPHPFAGFLAKGWETTRSTHLFLASVFFLAALPAPAQTPPSAQPHGQVIFSRSTDASGQTTTTAGPAAPEPTGLAVAAPTATDAERQAVTFTAFDMDVRLRSADHQIAVRALVTVRNDGAAPLARIPLQISSSLNWERIRVGLRDVAYTVATLNSDVDHTGQLHEAAVPLATPLAPGATLQLDVTYSGAITPSVQRLIALGTPQDVALHSDWDAIGVDFTGLRGFGNVVWYPASSVPAILGDGARVFDEMGKHKLRMAGARFRLRLTVEFPAAGHAPTVALINGHPAPLTIADPGSDEVAGIATASLGAATLGFEAPSLFVAVCTPRQAENTTLWTLPSDEPAVADWASAAAAVTPFLQGWLGQAPRSQLTILDLPDPEDAPFETGALLVTAIRQAAPEQLDGIMTHALTHAFLRTSTAAPPAWLDEGVAHFMGTLWIEKTAAADGREKALETLEADRMALALAEPSSPGVSAGQPLIQAISPIYYRTKAAYVFWMLRSLAGDPALSAALRAYSPAADAARGLGTIPGPSSGSFEKLVRQAMSAAGETRDLSWFFADWVDADKGLPDISIDSVFPTPAETGAPADRSSSAGWETGAPADRSSSAGWETGPTVGASSSAGPPAGSWLVTVDLSNSGYAAAEIPVTVSNANTSVTRRVVVPARGKATERILIQGRPAQVQANDGTVPETEASIHIMNLSGSGVSSSSSQSTGVPQ
jgi:hypothetical protein